MTAIPKLTTVVVINSLSYTGTTWLNLLLGTHPRSFALGPAERTWRMRKEGWDKACLIHGEHCSFWPQFHRRYDPDRNYFIQLAEFSGRDVIVTNNPTLDGAGEQLHHPDLEVKTIHLIRDGRALAASKLRHTPGISYLDAVTDFLFWPFHRFPFDPDDTEALALRYEDIALDTHGALARIGTFLGLVYPAGALRFWNFDHHISSGNQGTIALVRAGQGGTFPGFRDQEFYREQFERMQASANAAFNDERWRDELSRRDRFVFDVISGADNERFGYPRDAFTLSEIAQFGRELLQAATAPEFDGAIAEQIRERIAPLAGSAGQSSAIGGAGVPSAMSLLRQLRPAQLWRRGLVATPDLLRDLVFSARRRGFAINPRQLRLLAAVAAMVPLALIGFGILVGYWMFGA